MGKIKNKDSKARTENRPRPMDAIFMGIKASYCRDKPANFHQRRSLRKQTTPRLRRGTLPPPRQTSDFLPAAK
ncbi:MAG: hypothetical protein PUJ35_00565 [Ruminococcus bromii]|nr:hypothetical protein [Ruminococcus bromii]